MNIEQSHIVVAVCGGISAYKVPSILSALKHNGFWVTVMQTPNSEHFVTHESLQVMANGYWQQNWGRPIHIEITGFLSYNDAFLVVPATANTIAKIANGFGDNLVTDTALALNNNVKKIICPAMNSRMLFNKTVQRNIQQLMDDGWNIIKPVYGALACGTTGDGKLPPTRKIVDLVVEIMGKDRRD